MPKMHISDLKNIIFARAKFLSLNLCRVGRSKPKMVRYFKVMKCFGATANRKVIENIFMNSAFDWCLLLLIG